MNWAAVRLAVCLLFLALSVYLLVDAVNLGLNLWAYLLGPVVWLAFTAQAWQAFRHPGNGKGRP